MSAPDSRQRLLDRRPHWQFRFESGGQTYTGGIGRFDDGRIAEIFINGAKVGSTAEASAQDAAIVASLALQHGRPLDTIRLAWLDREAPPVHGQHCWAKSNHEAARTPSLSHPYPLRQARRIFAWRGGGPRWQVCWYNPKLVSSARPWSPRRWRDVG